MLTEKLFLSDLFPMAQKKPSDDALRANVTLSLMDDSIPFPVFIWVWYRMTLNMGIKYKIFWGLLEHWLVTRPYYSCFCHSWLPWTCSYRGSGTCDFSERDHLVLSNWAIFLSLDFISHSWSLMNTFYNLY